MQTDLNFDPTFEMNEQAARALEAINANQPVVFLTGRAGTGKTRFIEFIRTKLNKNTVVVAPTGVAALNIKGVTIHKFFRFPARLFSEEEIRSRKHDPVVKKLDLLIIDEISMVRVDLIDRIDAALRKWKNNDQPFGGVQLLLTGDLLQLPPVVQGEFEKDYIQQHYNSAWFFDAKVFQTIPITFIELQKIYRQKEPHFAQLLSRIRINQDHRDAVAEINRKCFRDVADKQADLILTATNHQAEQKNTQCYAQITAAESVYTGSIEGEFPLDEKRLPAPRTLRLKVGAQVMVIKNIDEAVNGTLGIVTRLHPDSVEIRCLDTGKTACCKQETWEQYEYTLDKETQAITAKPTGKYKQIPLVWGWAITIHKSQGLTLDSVVIDLGRGAFSPGQTYVALSRCKAIETLRLCKPIAMSDVRADARIVAFYEQIRETLKSECRT